MLTSTLEPLQLTELPTRGGVRVRQPGLVPALMLALLLATAFAVRVGTMLAWPSMVRPDEVFQALEPAHRLLTGWSVVSWEWRDGIRSWMFPGFLAGVMFLARHTALGTGGTLATVACVMATASLGPVVMAWRSGQMEAGLAGAIGAAVPIVLWPDLVHFAPRTLTEVQGGHLLLFAAALAAAQARCEQRRSVVVGAVLGACFVMRFHFLPAMIFVAWWQCRWRPAAWAALAAGAAGPVLLSGLLDWITLGLPFQSDWKNFVVNVVQNRSEDFGVSPPLWYVEAFGSLWGMATIPVAVCFVAGAERQRLFALLAGIVLLSHSVVAHKEVSFVYPAVLAVLLVAGTGSVVICRRLAAWLDRPRWAVLLAGTLVWATLATGVAVRERGWWAPWPGMWAGGVARQQADLCGVGLYGIRWYEFGGYTVLDRPVPIDLAGNPEELAQVLPGVNVVVAPETLDVSGFSRSACHDGVCVWHGTRACQGTSPFEIDRVLIRLEQ